MRKVSFRYRCFWDAENDNLYFQFLDYDTGANIRIGSAIATPIPLIDGEYTLANASSNGFSATTDIYYYDNSRTQERIFQIRRLNPLSTSSFNQIVPRIYGVDIGYSDENKINQSIGNGELTYPSPIESLNGNIYLSSRLPITWNVTSESTSFDISGIAPPYFSLNAIYNPLLGDVDVVIPSGIYNLLLNCQYKDVNGSVGGGSTTFTSVVIELEDVLIPLSATFTKTDVTVNGGSDGTIQVIATDGSGNYSFAWADSGDTTPNRTGLAAGDYEATITDVTTLEVVVLDISISEPAIELTPDPYFEVPKIQSLHFVKETITDTCSEFETLDNTLLCFQNNPGFQKFPYLQKVKQCDKLPIQIRSTTDQITAELLDENEVVQYTFIPELKRNLINVPTTFDVNINTNHDVESGVGEFQSRVYFVGMEEIPLIVGDIFQIQDSLFGFEGTYELVDIGFDSLRNQEYAVINLTYTESSEDTATLFISENLVPFDIYEVIFDFGSVAFGNYFAKITGGVESGDIVYISEGISVKSNHKKTLYLTATNTDNAYDIDYTTGITHIMRIDAQMVERLGGADRETLRNTNNSLQLLRSKPKRRLRMKTIGLPPYLHEKLSVMLEHDTLKIQGVQFRTEEGYQEPTYFIRSYFANGEVILEQIDWLNNSYNSDDLRGIDESDDLLIINESFLKL